MKNTDDMDRSKKKKSGKVKKRKIFLLLFEIVIFLVLLMVVFYLWEIRKLNITKLDEDKIATNARNDKTNTATTLAETETQIITSVNAEGDTIEIAIPVTTASEAETDTLPEDTISDDEETTEENRYDAPFGDEGYKTLVIFGVDARSHGETYTKGSNSDVMIIVSINNENGDVKMCSVYRDTYMKMYGNGTYDKANAGFCRYDVYEAINTLNMNLDISITDFICIDWAAAIEIINALGGAYIELKPEFYETASTDSPTGKVPYLNGLIEEIVNSTGFECAQIPQEYFDGRLFLANGVQAVAYMRLRYTDSDLQRTMRQRDIINQIVTRAKNSDIGTLLKVWDIVSGYVELSLDETQILGMLYNLLNYNIVDTHGYPFQLYSGADYAWPMTYNMITIDMVRNVKELHQFLYNDENYEPTQTIYELSEELRLKANLKEDWTPNFYAPYFSVLDTDPYK